MHVEFKVTSFEYVFNVCIWEDRETGRTVCCLPWFLHSVPLSCFSPELCRKSQIKDGWEGIDLLFRNYFVDYDPRGSYLWAF